MIKQAIMLEKKVRFVAFNLHISYKYLEPTGAT